MNWRAGEVMNIRMAKKVKKVNRRTYTKRWSTKRLPIPYARIVHQLSLEARHGDISDGHEAVRRGGYARRVLDAFGEELTAFKGVAKDFRSKVLTPILQRQLRGIPDNYAPHIRSNISNSRVIKPTIAETTAFYLGEDPIDPDFIPSYRRNLLYIREARWALWIVMGLAKVNSKEDYNRSLTAQDKIMEGLTFTRDEVEKMPGVNRDILDQVMELDTTLSLQPHYDGYESDSLPRFTYPEVRAIIFEGLEKYFAKELKEVVCTCAHPSGYTLTFHSRPNTLPLSKLRGTDLINCTRNLGPQPQVFQSPQQQVLQSPQPQVLQSPQPQVPQSPQPQVPQSQNPGNPWPHPLAMTLASLRSAVALVDPQGRSQTQPSARG